MVLSSIDFTKDIRYQQGVKLAKEESAINLIKEGVDLAFIQRTIGLSKKKTEELAAQVAAAKNCHLNIAGRPLYNNGSL